MLEQARAMLPPDGRLVVSVVLPASQSDAAASVGAEKVTPRPRKATMSRSVVAAVSISL